jgi:hypothetical protein
MVTFIGEPVPVTRGALLHFTINAVTRPPDQSTNAVNRPSSRPTRRFGASPRLDGRLAFEVQTLQTTTTGLGANPEVTNRDFVTPVARLRAAATNLPAGFELHAVARGERRYVAGFTPANPLIRVYRASLERGVNGSPVQVQIGRFASSYESFSGYWDGALVRVGGRKLGIGVAAGFEPDFGNQSFNADRPKYSAFVNFGGGGRAARYATDVSVHHVESGRGFPSRSFLGWSQYVGLQGLDLNGRVELDRDPLGNRVVLTRARVDVRQRVGTGLFLNARYVLRRPYTTLGSTRFSSVTRMQGSVGATAAGRMGHVSFTAGINRLSNGALSQNYSAAFALARSPIWSLDVHGSGSYWKGPSQSGVAASVGLSRSFGRGRVRTGYSYYRASFLRGGFISHALDGGIELPLTRRLRASLRARFEQSEHLRNLALYSGLSLGF